MALGFGLYPLGLGPFGIGTPLSVDPPPEGPPPDARYINPMTGDYVRADDGEFEGMPPVRQRVMLVLLRLELPRWVDETTARKVDNQVRLGLRQLTDVERVMRLRNVTLTTKPGGRVTVLVEYFDRTTNQPDQAER